MRAFASVVWAARAPPSTAPKRRRCPRLVPWHNPCRSSPERPSGMASRRTRTARRGPRSSSCPTRTSALPTSPARGRSSRASSRRSRRSWRSTPNTRSIWGAKRPMSPPTDATKVWNCRTRSTIATCPACRMRCGISCDRFVELLLKWQRVSNLIADSSVGHVWTRHIADSLQLIALAPDARTWVDLGSGAGFPGLVLACALADTAGAMVHLIESNAKKAGFLREAARVTQAAATVHHGRAEDLIPAWQHPVDVVTARALAPLSILVGLAAPMVKKGAKALFLKGQDVEAELTEATKYWNIETVIVPSRTDSRGRIVEIRAVTARNERLH